MTPGGDALELPAKRMAIVVGTLSGLLFLPSLLPAGFAIFMLDAPGSGPMHQFYVMITITVLLLMPVICLLGAIMPWRAYKQGKYKKVVIWTCCTVVLMLYWSPFAYAIYFT